MQLLILNANGMIWGMGKSLNWNHMEKHLEFFFSWSIVGGKKTVLLGGKIQWKK